MLLGMPPLGFVVVVVEVVAYWIYCAPHSFLLFFFYIADSDDAEQQNRARATTMPSRPRGPRAPPLTVAQQRQQSILEKAQLRPMSIGNGVFPLANIRIFPSSSSPFLFTLVVVESPVAATASATQGTPARRKSVSDSPKAFTPSALRPLVNEVLSHPLLLP